MHHCVHKSAPLGIFMGNFKQVCRFREENKEGFRGDFMGMSVIKDSGLEGSLTA
jgi:hypothetical protein